MSSQKRKTLGRGLNALLGDESEPKGTGTGAGQFGAQAVPIEFLHPGKYQPRHAMDKDAIAELAASIEKKGVLQPLLVRRHPGRPEEYEIIAGERRWRASQLAQLHEVPVIIKELSDVEALEIGLIENLQRLDLSPIEEAQGYQRLLDEFKHTQEALSGAVGKSRSHVANTLRLLNLPQDVKDMVESGALSAGHARALLSSDDIATLAKKVVKDGLNVRQTERLVRQPSKVRNPAGVGLKKDADTLALERDMTAMLGLNVNISSGGKGGSLTVHYKTLDQLDEILHRLSHGTPPVDREETVGDIPSDAIVPPLEDIIGDLDVEG